MKFSDETLMAYADGELDGPTHAAVEAAQAADPELARRIAQHQALRSRLRRAFDPVLAEPLPEQLLASARGAAAASPPDNVVPLKRRFTMRASWPQWSAIAASLLLGTLLGPWLMRAPQVGPLVAHEGTVLASGALARALSEQLASNQPPGAPVQIGVSFRSRGGEYCRTFVLHDKSALAGLACRERGAWRLEALAAGEPAPAGTGEYRAAATALPPVVASALDALIAGEPLDARAEAAARARAWSR
jgi:hypothetical protein